MNPTPTNPQTPETDAMACPFVDLPSEPSDDWVVPADFARSLETRLLVALAENEKLQAACAAKDEALKSCNAAMTSVYVPHPQGREILQEAVNLSNYSQSSTSSQPLLDRLAKAEEDTERIDKIEAEARKSRTGISFDWIPSCEGEPQGYRFMRYHHISEPKETIRAVIDAARSTGGER